MGSFSVTLSNWRKVSFVRPLIACDSTLLVCSILSEGVVLRLFYLERLEILSRRQSVLERLPENLTPAAGISAHGLTDHLEQSVPAFYEGTLEVIGLQMPGIQPVSLKRLLQSRTPHVFLETF